MVVKIYIGNYKIDLFKEESISITSSVLDIEDITKNTTDYSKSFTVPATANNNTIFKHYYDADIDNTFDARIKIEGRIELDGMPFKTGKWSLQKVSVKKGNPSSYTINFFGNLVSIKDLLRETELNQLDFSAYNHTFDSINVLVGLTSYDLFNGAIIYNLFAKKQFYYTSSGTDFTQTDQFSNIAYTTTGANGVKYTDLRPSIKLIKIIEAIEADYQIEFTREFFGRDEFTNLYMWLNPDKESALGGGSQRVNFTSGDSTNISLITDIGTFVTINTSASGDKRYWELGIHIYPAAGYESVGYTIKFFKEDGVLGAEKSYYGYLSLGSTLTNDGTGEDEYTWLSYWEISSQSEFKYTTTCYQSYRSTSGVLNFYTTYGAENTIGSGVSISDNMPKLKIIDFLKGIFKMFKLVVIPQDDGTIYVNTLKDFYEEGSIFDITNFVDFESYEVQRGKILNEITYEFQDPTTIINKQFKENTGKGYGDEIAYLKDDAGTPLDGESLTIELPFEQIIYDRIIDLEDQVQTNLMIGSIVNEKIDPVNPKAHIFYNIPQNVGSKAFGFLRESSKTRWDGLINTPFHINTLIDQKFSTTFSQEINEWNGSLISNTLYSNNQAEYINAVFNIKRRNFVFKAKKLPLRILLNLELNDVLQIKNSNYRIDKITTDLVTSETEFNLINSFDYKINAFSCSDTNIFLTKYAQSYSVFVTNLTTYTVSKISTGYGTDWISVTDDGVNIIFTVIENITSTKSVFIKLTDTATSQEIDFTITQDIGVIRMDSTIFKFDSTLITIDNE